MVDVKVKLLDAKAKVPTRSHDLDTGYDISLIETRKMVGDVIFFGTGVSLQPPAGYYFEVVPRSSLSKYPFSLANSVGIIDEHYRGEIMVPLRVLHSEQGHHKPTTSYVSGMVDFKGMKPQNMQSLAFKILTETPSLFKLILRKRLDCEFTLVEVLDETERGSGGFGSTGNKR